MWKPGQLVTVKARKFRGRPPKNEVFRVKKCKSRWDFQISVWQQFHYPNCMLKLRTNNYLDPIKA